jgi:ABC-type polysaccharide/polyol phosphate export permease
MKTTVSIFWGELYGSREVLAQLVSQQLILRYRRTTLGFFWTLINPLLMMSVMAVVFSTLFAADLKTFTIFLFSGMIPWGFFSSVVTQSGASYINNEGLIKKIYLPKVLFPLSIAIALLIDSVLSFFALFAIIIMVGGTLSWALLFTPIAYLLLFFFAFGIGLIMAVATVFFRDLQHVILIAMQGLFFLTPIFYKHDALAGKIGWLVNLNPVVPFIELFRAPLYLTHLPSIDVVLQAIIIDLCTMGLGLLIFFRYEKKIIFRL